MANRFPLILNTSSNQIQEIPSGDTLDLAGTGLNLTGITTLSTSAQLNLGGGTNINTGTRGDILFYNSAGRIEKLSLGATGKILKSNGTDLVYGDSGSVVNVYYVSPAGTDASGFGGSVDRAFKTIKYACSNIGTPTATSPAIIFIKAGTYEEVQLPIVVPAHTTIAGDSLRATIIKPGSGLDSGGSVQNNRSILFRMSNATVLQDLVMDGMGGYSPGSPAHKPESATIGGIYLALNAASPILTKSPYIYNVTSFGNGATGAVLDGSVHSTGNRSMLFHTYTAVHSDGLGVFLKANANAEMISTFTYYCTVGFACIGGSKIRSLNSSNAYGEYAVYSAGFDAGESANQGTVRGNMLTYVGVLSQSFTDGEQITGGTSGATAYVVNVQSEPKVMYIVQKSGTFQANETVTGGSSGATATMAAANVETNQSGRILVTQFSSSADAGDSLQFATTDGNAYQIQSVSSVTANSVAYHILVFSTSRPTPVASGVTVNVRKEFSLIRLTGHDFLQVGTGGTDTTNWPNNPTQNPNQAYQVMTNSTDPGRVYYTATDDLGNFYVGDQFKVDQATGNVTLDASAFNLSGLESLRLGSVGGLIGAAVNEFSTDVTLSQNSDTKVSTQKAVKTYVDTLDDVTPVGGTFSIAGIGTVTGTTLFTKQLNVSGISTFNGNVDLLDGDRLRLGNSQDLQAYHDGNNSYIAENGTGNLLVTATTGSIQLLKSNGHKMIVANTGDSVESYFNNTKRIETTNTGAKVTGNLEVTGVLTYEDVTSIDSVGIITAQSGVRVTSGGIKVTSGVSYFNANIVGTATTALSITTTDESSDTSCNVLFATAATGNLAPKTGTNLTFNSSSGQLTATSFSGNGASLTNLNGSNIASGTVPVARIGTGTKNTTTFYRGDGTFQVVNTDLISDTSPQLGGDLDCNNKVVTLNDSTGAGNNRLKIGNAGDLQLFHQSNANYVSGEVDGKDLYVRSRRDLHLVCGNNSGGYRNVIYADNNGTARLYHPALGSATPKLQTTTTGIEMQSAEDVLLHLNADTDNSDETHNPQIKFSQDGNLNHLNIGIEGNGNQTFSGSTGNYPYIHVTDAHSGGIGLEIATNNICRLRIQNDGHTVPAIDNTYNLGTSTRRWANIYSADLHCSNKGSKNDVDGTWGDFTIQEGESDLFLINNRSGKKYKFNLTEVN
jgi:hypothetical protein